jgi:hypothetical protein
MSDGDRATTSDLPGAAPLLGWPGVRLRAGRELIAPQLQIPSESGDRLYRRIPRLALKRMDEVTDL